MPQPAAPASDEPNKKNRTHIRTRGLTWRRSNAFAVASLACNSREDSVAVSLTAYSCFITSIVQLEATCGSFEELPFSMRAANAAVCYVAYLGQFVWPTNLAVLYPHPRETLCRLGRWSPP